MVLGRPVKFIADRLESFVSDIHARENLIGVSRIEDLPGRAASGMFHAVLADLFWSDGEPMLGRF